WPVKSLRGCGRDAKLSNLERSLGIFEVLGAPVPAPRCFEEGEFMKRWFHLVAAVLIALLASTHAFAQGGGASSTGTIMGKVTDASGGVLPGVTVNATSPSMMGVQSIVTNTEGIYRFPAVPPGTYTV